jgi:ferric-dicitrate binding protein FerR (iron transport regulator)
MMDELIIKVLEGEASAAEIGELARWMVDGRNEARFYQLKKAWHLAGGVVLDPLREEEELQRYLARIRASRGRRARRVRWMKYAALLALPALGAATFFYLSRPAVEGPAGEAGIQPGRARALLFLDDRQPVELTAGRGAVVRADSVLAGEAGGEVAFLPGGAAGDGQKWYRLVTPRGGEYRLTLADGTRVFLNSGTTVEFPAGFAADRREARLSGEAYFEVAAEGGRPFTVTTGKTSLLVLGTTFNVEAYEGERTRVVLVTGKVGVRGTDGEERLLQPSTLAEFDAGGRFTGAREVDARAATAWREGFFAFENEDIERILEALARWYDVGVSYIDEEVKGYHFTGSVGRHERLDDILEALGKTVPARFSAREGMIVVSR